MPKIASILTHTNAYAPSVDSDTIRGGFLSVRATASGLAGEFDPDAALQSDGNKQDLIKEKATVVYVTDQTDYFILDNKTESDVAPGSANSGWITLLSAIGGQASSSVVADAHSGISGAADIDGSGLTFIQDITMDDYGHVTNLATATVTQASLDVDHLVTLSGVSTASDDLGTFTGNTIADNVTIKAALQALETQVDSNSNNTGTTDLTQTTAAGSLTVNSSSGNNVTLQNASATLAGIVTAEAQTIAGNKTFSNNVTVSGNLTVTGDMVQQSSTTVVFNDTFLDLNVANSASTYTTDSGFKFGRKTSAANTLSENAAFIYDPGTDTGDVTSADYSGCFRFVRHTDSATGVFSAADNVAALKFTVSDSNTQVDQTDGATTQADADEANASSVRSLAAIAKCSIHITNTAEDGDSGTVATDANYAPDTAALNGYPVKHNLGTSSVYVMAIKDPAGTPIPIIPRYEPIDNRSVRVWLGKTAVNENYDVIVIG